jgi:uncharacterized protein (TIGR03437 family)
MDALQLLRKTALLLASGLLLATAGMADDLVVDNSNVAINFTTTAQTVHVTSATGNPTPFTIGPTTYDQPYQWLSVLYDTLTTPATLTVTRNYTPPFGGPFTAHFSVIPSNGGASQTINVTYTTAIVQPSGLTVVPSSSNPSYSVQFSYTTNGALPTQQATVSGVSSYTASTSAGWLVLSAGGQTGTTVSDSTGSGSLTITVDQSAVASLGTAPATYQQNVSVTGPSGSGLQATIVVTLTVNGGAGSAIAVTPTSLSFTYQIGGPSVPPQTLVLTAPAGTVYSAQADVSWLALSGAQGDVPGQIQVYVVSSALSGFAANTYTGHVTINDGSLKTTVAVSLLVTDSSSPILTATVGNGIGTLVFNSQGSVAIPASQTVALTASDGSAITPTIVSNPTWTTVTLNGNILTVTPNVSGLGAATYSDNIVVSANNLANSPISIPIILVTNGGGNGGPLTFSQSSLTFTGTVGGTTPSSQNLTVTGPAGTAFTLTAQTASGGNWLSVSPAGSLTLPTNTLTISVNPAGVGGAGTYNGSLQFNVNGVVQAVPVTLVLTGTGSGGNVTSSPTSLTFTAQFGGTAQNAPLTISNAAAGTAGIVYTVSTSASWLKASPTQATTQSTVTVTADPSSLAPGSYQGQVTITPTGGTALNVPVTLTVQALPTISVSSTSLTFTYRSGGATPATQSVMVSGGAFTTQVTSDGNFLAVTPTSGTAATSLSVSVTPTGLSIGTHTGTITVSGTSGVTGQAVTNVTLTVTAPLPTVTGLSNGASFIQGPISPGEVITLTGTDLGPATPATAQIDASGKLATQLGSVQVLVDGFPAPMIYASATQVSAVVPYEVANYTTAITQVKYLGQSSNAVSLTVSATAPGIFTQNSSGSGPGAFNADFSLNGPNNPAAKGGSVVFFLTGEGLLTPAGVTGTINGANPPAPVQRVTVLVDGQGANYTYAAGITGVVEGILQLNVQIPPDARSGDLPVVVSIGGRSTQSGVTVSVK